VSGFLLNNAPPEQLTDAVRVVAGGDASLAPFVTRTNTTRTIAACRFGLAATLPPEGGLVSSVFVGAGGYGLKGAVNGCCPGGPSSGRPDDHHRLHTCADESHRLERLR
jgi:hypothetical protein